MDTNDPSSILIVKTSAIGDVIQTFPVLDYLRKKFPAARIDWVAEQGISPLLKAHPQLDNVLEIRSKVWRKNPLSSQTRLEFRTFTKQLRETNYDLLFDLQGNAKSAVVTAAAKAREKIGFGWKSVREKCNLLVTHKRFNFSPDLNIRLKYFGLVQSYFNDTDGFETQGVRLKISREETERLQDILSKEPKLMVCFGSKWPNKRLEVATLTALLEKIALECDPVFLFIYGDEEERRIAEALSAQFKKSIAVGGLSLPLWQALMWEMDGVMAVDSAALHLCGTTDTPSFSVFGPSLAAFYKPPGEGHLSVQGSCPYGKTFSARCPILRTCSTGACIRHLQVDALFDSFKKWSSRLKASAETTTKFSATDIDVMTKMNRQTEVIGKETKIEVTI
jgi:heptosyltransferase-1